METKSLAMARVAAQTHECVQRLSKLQDELLEHDLHDLELEMAAAVSKLRAVRSELTVRRER